MPQQSHTLWPVIGDLEIVVWPVGDEPHRTTWRQFCVDNVDMDPEALTRALEEALAFGLVIMGGGACPEVYITILD